MNCRSDSPLGSGKELPYVIGNGNDKGNDADPGESNQPWRGKADMSLFADRLPWVDLPGTLVERDSFLQRRGE
jgi:hypothetical protein